MLQQTVTYYDAPQNDTATQSIIPVAKGYSADNLNGTGQFDVPLLGALYNGMIPSNVASLSVEPDCPTGNCTFSELYGSLGFCSACTNITPFMSAEFTNTTADTLSDNFYSALALNTHFPGTSNTAAFSMAATVNQIAMNWTSSQTPNSAFNLSDYKFPFVFGDARQPNMSIPAISAPFGVIFSTSITRNEHCTTDWMRGGPPRGDSDCLDPTLVDPSVDIHGPNVWEDGNTIPLEEEAVQVQPDGSYINFTDFQAIPITAWPKLTASACSLSFCSQTFRSKMELGKLREEKVSDGPILMLINDTSQAADDKNLFYSAQNVFIPSNCIINGTSHSIRDFVDVDGVLRNDSAATNYNGIIYRKRSEDAQHRRSIGSDIFTNSTLSHPRNYRNWSLVVETSPDRDLLEQCAWPMAPITTVAQTILSQFGGFMYFSTEPTDPSLRAVDINPWTQTSQITGNSQGSMTKFFNGGNASTSSFREGFDQVAASLSNHIRQVSKSYVVGQTQKDQAFVQVTFEWLILPAVLTSGSVAFLFATIWKAKREMGDRVWKSNQLALVMHGLDQRDRYGALTENRDMEGFAKSLDVRLGMEHLGWRMIKDQKMP